MQHNPGNSLVGETLIKAVDGRAVTCRGSTTVTLSVEEVQFNIRVLVLERIIDDIDVILGMDAIDELGGVMVAGNDIQF